MVRRALRIIAVLVGAWFLLAYGVPAARATVPRWCAQWHLAGGFCTERFQETLQRTDAWVERFVRPLPRHARVRRAAADAASALARVERLVREEVGDEQVEHALRGADEALRRLEDVVGGTEDVREKLADVPENAWTLLSRARVSFERLRRAVGTSSRRAEDVSEALAETQNALNALSGVLPKPPEDLRAE